MLVIFNYFLEVYLKEVCTFSLFWTGIKIMIFILIGRNVGLCNGPAVIDSLTEYHVLLAFIFNQRSVFTTISWRYSNSLKGRCNSISSRNIMELSTARKYEK